MCKCLMQKQVFTGIIYPQFYTPCQNFPPFCKILQVINKHHIQYCWLSSESVTQCVWSSGAIHEDSQKSSKICENKTFEEQKHKKSSLQKYSNYLLNLHEFFQINSLRAKRLLSKFRYFTPSISPKKPWE